MLEHPEGPRPRVLVIAYGCEPDKGSEQGVGWNWSLQLARFAEVVVVTRANNRAVIEGERQRLDLPDLEFVYFDLPDRIRRLKRKAWSLYPYYVLWQWGSYRLARRLYAQRPFTCVIQLTFGSIWMPVFAHRLPGRFIWGPIGGGEAIPPHLLSQVGCRLRFIETLRRILIATIPANPLVLSVLRRAETVIVRTPDTAALVPARFKDRVRVILETGLSQRTLDALTPIISRRPNDAPIVLFTGRLVGFKNVDMLLYAAAEALKRETTFTLRIVGSGPDRKKLERLARELGISHAVTFTGALMYSAVMDELRNADVYAYPSLREGGVWSLMEAMSAGLPVVCVDTSGMSVITDEGSAIRIAPESRDVIIEGFANALSQLCASPERRRELGARARARMHREFLWDRKGDAIRALLFSDHSDPHRVVATRRDGAGGDDRILPSAER